MRLIDLPRVVYERVSERLGIITEAEYHDVTGYAGASWTIRRLPNYHSAIGHAEIAKKQLSLFAVWYHVEKGIPSELEEYPVFVLRVTGRKGNWAHGRGYQIQQTALFEMTCGVQRLDQPSSEAIALAITLGHEMVQDCIQPMYWEAEKDPNGKYTKP